MSAQALGASLMRARVVERLRMARAARVLVAASTAPIAAYFWGTPEWRGAILLIAAMLWWTIDLGSGSGGYLFAHDQVRAFSVAYVLLSLCGLLVSIPLWRLLGLLP